MNSNNVPQELYNAFTRIAELVEWDDKGSQEHFIGLAEEIGEVATDLQIRNKTSCKSHKEPGDGVLVESMDVMICAICLYLVCGGNLDDVPEIVNAKLDKWEKLLKIFEEGDV